MRLHSTAFPAPENEPPSQRLCVQRHTVPGGIGVPLAWTFPGGHRGHTRPESKQPRGSWDTERHRVGSAVGGALTPMRPTAQQVTLIGCPELTVSLPRRCLGPGPMGETLRTTSGDERFVQKFQRRSEKQAIGSSNTGVRACAGEAPVTPGTRTRGPPPARTASRGRSGVTCVRV